MADRRLVVRSDDYFQGNFKGEEAFSLSWSEPKRRQDGINGREARPWRKQELETARSEPGLPQWERE